MSKSKYWTGTEWTILNTALSTTTSSSGDLIDANGNELLKLTAVDAAVNELTLTNAATGNPPTINASGGDTDIGINIVPRGAGAVNIQGNAVMGEHSISFTSKLTRIETTTATVDWSIGTMKRELVLASDTTLTFTDPNGACNLMLLLTQDNTTGGRKVTWPDTVKWSGGVAPTLTTTTSKTDVISLYYNGTYYYATYALDF